MSGLADLMSDADLALDTIRNGISPAFRRAAADFLCTLAEEIRAEVVAEQSLSKNTHQTGEVTP